MDQSLKDFFINYNRKKPLRVLLVDDDPISLLSVEKAFVICGFKVDLAYDGSQAIEMVRNAIPKYDFILMDIHMPNVDGVTATREIKKVRGYDSVPVFAVTGDISLEAKMEVVSVGMSEYFNKPLDKESVLLTIKTYL